MRNRLVLGDWNVICDRCGLKYKASQLRKEWTGLMVCSPCWEPRHPQTLIKVPEEHGGVPWSRPEPTDIFVGDSPLETEDGNILMSEQPTVLNTET